MILCVTQQWFVNGSIEVTIGLYDFELVYNNRKSRSKQILCLASSERYTCACLPSGLVSTFQGNSKILINIYVGQMRTIKI